LRRKKQLTRIKNVRNTTKFKRSIKAISPVIATLLMIAIAVVASLVVYAWVTGYMGNTTSKAGKAIQIQSFATSGSNLVVYVQNVGQGDVELNRDQSVYINSNLVPITDPATNTIPIIAGQTVGLTLPLPAGYAQGDKLNIKVTTTDGTFMTASGTGGSSNPTTPATTYAVNFVLGTPGGLSMNPTGAQTVGGTIAITATANSGYHFTSWTSSTGSITFGDANLASTSATINGAGTVTANFAADTVQYSVTFVLGANGATITPTAGPHSYDAGSSVPITATANSGYHFTSWTSSTGSITFGDANSASTTATIGAAGTVTANFAVNTPLTITLRPNANGDSQLSRNTGSNNYQAVDEDPSDDATTYVYDNSGSDGYARDYYGFTDHTTETGTINSVTVYIDCRQLLSGGSTSQSHARTVLRYNGNSNYGTDINLGTSWTVYQTAYTARPGGGSWTWADIDALQAGVSLDSADLFGSTQSQAQATQVYVIVTYTP
jgi:flagellin-like protein